MASLYMMRMVEREIVYKGGVQNIVRFKSEDTSVRSDLLCKEQTVKSLVCADVHDRHPGTKMG